MSGRDSAPLQWHVIPECSARLPVNPVPRRAHTVLMTEAVRLYLKPDLNPYLHSYPILTHPLASPSRTSLHAEGATPGRRQRRSSNTTGDAPPKPLPSTRSSTTLGMTYNSSGRHASSTSMGAYATRC